MIIDLVIMVLGISLFFLIRNIQKNRSKFHSGFAESRYMNARIFDISTSVTKWTFFMVFCIGLLGIIKSLVI